MIRNKYHGEAIGVDHHQQVIQNTEAKKNNTIGVNIIST
jgi:hypothetical protein